MSESPVDIARRSHEGHTSSTPVLNATLLVSALAILLLASVVTDRIIGWLAVPRPLPNAMELVFPPGSIMAFKTNEFQCEVDINSFGYRDVEPSAVPEGAYRIAAIGDSFTYGYGVQIGDTWVKQLEANLRRAGINAATLNLGKPGAAVDFYAEVAERAIPVLKPNLVLVAMLQSDDMTTNVSKQKTPRNTLLKWTLSMWPNLVRLANTRLENLAPRTSDGPVHPPMKSTAEENRKAQAAAAQDVLDKMSAEQRERFDRLDEGVRKAFLEGDLNPYLINISSQYPDSLRSQAKGPADYRSLSSVAATAAYLRRVLDAARRVGARVLVFSVPLGVYANEHALRGYARAGFTTDAIMLTTQAPDRMIEAACKEAGLPFYAVTEGFRARRADPSLYFPLDGHFTPAGHALFAELITPIVSHEIDNTKN